MQAGRVLPRRVLDCKPLLAVLHPDDSTGYLRGTESENPRFRLQGLPRAETASVVEGFPGAGSENVLGGVSPEHDFLQWVPVCRVPHKSLRGLVRLLQQRRQLCTLRALARASHPPVLGRSGCGSARRSGWARANIGIGREALPCVPSPVGLTDYPNIGEEEPVKLGCLPGC
jgi:hypothetical protein